jgi:hypothetical protein
MPVAEPKYHVRIRYREPSYERRAGRRPQPYVFEYQLTAPSADAAAVLAAQEFKASHRLSGVGWTREIVGIEVWRDGEPEPPATRRRPTRRVPG